MKISYVYYTDWHPSRSHGKQIINTINSLENRGNAITLISPASIADFLRENRMNLDASARSVNVIDWNKHAARFTYYTIATVLSRQKDVIFTRDIWYLKYLQYVPTFLYPPVLYEAHQCYAGQNYISPEDEHQRLRQADRVITQSYGVASDLSSLDIEVSDVIPNAAPASFVPEVGKEKLRTEFGFSPESTVIIYAGSFARYKNDFKLLVDAMALLEEHEESFEIAFVGGSEEEIDEVRAYCERILTNTAYHFFGRVPHKAVFRYLKAADIGVIPLKSTDQEALKYTSPIKLFEYLVSGLQVVAADVPSVESQYGPSDPVCTYSADCAESLATTISSATIGRQRVDPERYSYQTRAKRIEPHLQAIL